jgi:monovalent cation:H+ antiporter-2, CPA2 family
MIAERFPVVLAAGAVPQYMTEAVALIVAGAVIAYICFRLRLVPIVGFLLAGVLIGPNALGLVKDQALVDATAEIGVILLLFTIGIEFSLAKLARIQRLIFGGGTMQVGLSIAVTAGILLAFGVDWKTGIFTGMLVALSSTAIVLKLLADKSETNSEPGQVGLGLLIFQDLAIVVMVMLVPVLAGTGNEGAAGIGIALAKAVGIILLVLVVARRIMPKILETVAKTCSPELFLLSIVAICFGTAYLTSLAGVSLSLGAFLAGLMVSESSYSHHALSETLPLQILFSATFFVSVGMLLDVNYLVNNLPIIFAAIGAVLAIKIISTGVAVRTLGYKAPVAAASALMLAQIGEFSFVLERAGREVGLFPMGMGAAGSQTFIATTVVLMVLTPLLMNVGSGLSAKIVRKRQIAGAPESAAEMAEPLQLEDHVIVAGYGKAAHWLVRVLAGSGIPYVITTLSPDSANEAESAGLPVVRGDATKPFLLNHVGIANAKMLVIPDDDPSTAHRITAVARSLNPMMRIVVRTRYTSEVDGLAKAGADAVIAEELESVVQVFGDVLRDYRIPAEEIEAHEELARKNGYSAFLDLNVDTSIFRCETDNECLDSRTVKVRADAPVAGKALAALSLMNMGLTVRSVMRGSLVFDPPPAELVLVPGDELVMAGETRSFARSAAFFRAPNDTVAESPVRVSPVAPDDENARAFKTETGIDTETRIDYSPKADASVCSHLDQIRPVYPSASGCEECLRTGDKWVYLRLCLSCGHVGCCDSSENQHARAHYHKTGHAVMRSIEVFDDWAWCFEDEEYI